MIPIPSGVHVWIASGHTDMRRGMNSLALQVQQALGRNPHDGNLFVFRGRRGDLIKVLWHDAIGMSLYANELHSYYIPFVLSRRFCLAGILSSCGKPISKSVPTAALFLR